MEFSTTFRKVSAWSISIFFMLNLQMGIAQRNCGAASYNQEMSKKFPQIKGRFSSYDYTENYIDSLAAFQQAITIPVVVNIVYKRPEENITDEQILKQIQILNEDYSGANSEIHDTPPNIKKKLAGDCYIRFVLHAVTRTRTNIDVFYLTNSFATDYIKYGLFGGVDAGIYSTNRFLNIWVGNISDGSPKTLCGYSTFPGDPAKVDGVVINYKTFGIPGLIPQFNKGRTATHEIGHWLGLHHLWGDTDFDNPDCADDFISDTPLQQFANFGIPVYPKLPSCENHPDGDMFMNFMDYTDDSCMAMFTQRQKDRMRANFLPGGARADIISNYPNNLALVNNSYKVKYAKYTFINISADKLKWERVPDANGYEISVKSLDGFEEKNFKSKVNQVELHGLPSGKLYEVEVVPNDSKGMLHSKKILFLSQ